MLLTTRQVAEKLGITHYAVKQLAVSRTLVDHGMTRPGKSRHFRMFDSRQVNEYLKNRQPRLPVKEPATLAPNGYEVPMPVPPVSQPPLMLQPQSISARLDQLKAEIAELRTITNQLLALWQ